MTDKAQLPVRWLARLLGLVLVALVLLITIGEGGPPNPWKQPFPVQIETLGLLLIVAGLLVGWRWEAWGGAVTLAGFAIFCCTELAVNGRLPSGAIPLFALPGILFLASYGLGAVARRSPGG